MRGFGGPLEKPHAKACCHSRLFHGIEPAPERSRQTTWKEFLSRHWELIVAADFFTVEVWTCRGLQRFVVLFFMELSTRRVHVAGIARQAVI